MAVHDSILHGHVIGRVWRRFEALYEVPIPTSCDHEFADCEGLKVREGSLVIGGNYTQYIIQVFWPAKCGDMRFERHIDEGGIAASTQ
jgi:hypothetical protein